MPDPVRQWLAQAEYDLETAQYMFDGQRYFYAVFMLHMSLEKTLKGLYQRRLGEVPPKVHNLVYLLQKTSCRPPAEIGKYLVLLNQASVATRYPEDLARLQRDYGRELVEDLLARGRKASEWIREQF